MKNKVRLFLLFIIAILLQWANSLPVETQQIIQLDNNTTVSACWSVQGRKTTPCYFVELEITNPEMIAA